MHKSDLGTAASRPPLFALILWCLCAQFGDTALHWAVMGGTAAHDKIVKKLVVEGADANIVGAKAFTVAQP